MWIYLPKIVLELQIFGHVNRHCLRQCVNVSCETYDEHHRVKTWSKNNIAMNDITITVISQSKILLRAKN